MKRLWKHRALAVMALPGFLILFFFDYVVMGGLVLAFKDFDYRLGIWNSPWNGLENFRFLIASRTTFFTITRNTLMYYAIFTVVGTVLEISLAIAETHGYDHASFISRGNTAFGHGFVLSGDTKQRGTV